MSDELSRISTVFEEIGTAIVTAEHNGEILFEDIPIYWDMVELSANTMPTTCIVFSANAFKEDKTKCHFERQLDIAIIHNTDYPREITLRLSKYAEDLKEIIDNFILNSNLDLSFVGGSPIGYLKNNREDGESYKGTKTLFSSIIVLTYLLRY